MSDFEKTDPEQMQSDMESSNLEFRIGRKEDLLSIVRLLADDDLGYGRETIAEPLDARYLDAFEAIDSDPNNELILAVWHAELVGILQLTYIPNLTHKGSWRAQIEGVRVSSKHRSLGIGGKLLNWSIDRSRERGCSLVQLTTDLRREDALEFYRRHGFEQTHVGLKLWIKPG